MVEVEFWRRRWRLVAVPMFARRGRRQLVCARVRESFVRLAGAVAVNEGRAHRLKECWRRRWRRRWRLLEDGDCDGPFRGGRCTRRWCGLGLAATTSPYSAKKSSASNQGRPTSLATRLLPSASSRSPHSSFIPNRHAAHRLSPPVCRNDLQDSRTDRESPPTRV